VNVLIPTLSTGGFVTEHGLQLDADAVIESAVLPAETTEPGSVGLLSYESEVWERFLSSTTEVSRRPSGTLAMVAFPLDGRSVVVPAPDLGGEFVAVWLVAEDDSLDLLIADLGEMGPPQLPGDPLRSILARGPEVLQRSPGSYACANRRSTLACADRDCADGECVPISWFDPDYNIPMYGCVCAGR
jgi:hypothetical protein